MADSLECLLTLIQEVFLKLNFSIYQQSIHNLPFLIEALDDYYT